MKVKISETVEVTDEHRRQVADLNDDKVSRRQATRDELKDFIWQAGNAWEGILGARWNDRFGEDEEDEDTLDLDDELSDLI